MKLKRFTVLLMLLALALSACELLDDLIPQEQFTLIVNINGQGDVNYTGRHNFDADAVVTLTVSANEPWEFYTWTGEDADEVTEVNSSYRITMDRDKVITAFFANEFFDLVMEEHFFMGSEGTAVDLTANPPYPPGFVIELQATPASEEDTFLHWSITPGDPRDYFDDYEAELTKYTIPDFPVVVTPYFTKRTAPKEPGEFDFDHHDFGIRKEGEVGLTEHYWDIGEVMTGEDLNFYFHARNLPDRFRVYYGAWETLELIFCSGWVSLNPTFYANPAMYPEGVEYHDWHENVVLSNRITFRGSAGGGYASIITKESGKNVLVIEVEGRDEGTIWDYIVDQNSF